MIFKSNNKEWKAKLESCNCIYLILDKLTGKQYVGSTYNTKGIWGRWEIYANTGHGFDKDLQELINNDATYAQSISMVYIRNIAIEDIGRACYR